MLNTTEITDFFDQLLEIFNSFIEFITNLFDKISGKTPVEEVED